MGARPRTVYRCTECGAEHAKWAGRCDACGEWNTLVEEVLEIMAYDLRTSDIVIVRELAPGLSPLMADPHQLQQVFVNILSNARQAMEPMARQ